MDWFRKAIGWCWAHLGNFVWIGGLCASFALPAWATNVTGVFSEYAPLSWVIAGFIGVGASSCSMAIWAWAKGKFVRSAYDQKLLAKGGAIDPLDKTFERKRIYLNEFCLPSHPYIEGKTFIDCEIIGPANVILMFGNAVNDHKGPVCDAMVIAPGADPVNGYGFKNCIFRGCSFQRVTLMFAVEEYHTSARGIDWFRWTSILPGEQSGAPPLITDESETSNGKAA